MLADTIVAQRVDIAALQELRFDATHASEGDSAGGGADGMVAHIVEELRARGRHCAYRLHQSHQYSGGAHWEGKAVLLCGDGWEVHTDEALPLRKPPSSGDANSRNLQLLEVSRFGGARLAIANAHFSYVRSEYEANIAQTLEVVQRRWAHMPCFLLGDINVEPHDVALQPMQRALVDLWARQMRRQGRQADKGYTASKKPIRIDYVFGNRRAAALASDVTLVANVPNEDGLFASDHLPIVVTLNLPA